MNTHPLIAALAGMVVGAAIGIPLFIRYGPAIERRLDRIKWLVRAETWLFRTFGQ